MVLTICKPCALYAMSATWVTTQSWVAAVGYAMLVDLGLILSHRLHAHTEVLAACLAPLMSHQVGTVAYLLHVCCSLHVQPCPAMFCPLLVLCPNFD